MVDNPQTQNKPDLFVYVKNLFNFFKVILFDVNREIVTGFITRAVPVYVCLLVGIFLSGSLLIYLDGWIFSLFHKTRLLIPSGKFRDWLGLLSLFFGFYGWGIYRLFKRMMTTKLLDRAFINAGLETKLKERPQFYSDFPIDEYGRKLTLRAGGLPLSSFFSAKDHLESNLNVNITKMENPKNNKEFVDVIYTTEAMPDLWILENLLAYKDFSFPLGLSHRGEVKVNFRDIPHFLVAGESGAGKSTFIRMMLTVLLANNEDLEIHYLDFKSGMENQVFAGFSNLHRAEDLPEAAQKMNSLKKILDERMKLFPQAKARNLEMYNKSPFRKAQKEKRIVVVVDEASELMPTFKGTANTELAEINSTLNRIARMGRAVGINLVIGVQKPDAKNLDPTIKANLSGILCFAVSHFSQSMIVLGNGRGADLNKAYKGRAIWKHGLEFIEVQAPLLTEEEVNDVRNKIDSYWKQRKAAAEEKEIGSLNKAHEKNSEAGSPSA